MKNSETIINNVTTVDLQAKEFTINRNRVSNENKKIDIEITKNSPAINVHYDKNNSSANMSIGLAATGGSIKMQGSTAAISDSRETFISTVQLLDDAVLRQCTIIGDANVKESFEMKMDLPKGGHMEFSKDPIDNITEDGSVIVFDEKNQPICAIGVPWAKDNNGKTIKTYYKINGNVLTQVVKHHGQNYAYPIVSDPTAAFKQYFTSGTWKKNKNNKKHPWSLSLNPRNVLRNATLEGHYASAYRNVSWKAVYDSFHKSSHWARTGSMKNQYLCHFNHAPTKSRWNLEPSRKEVSYIKTVSKKCNP